MSDYVADESGPDAAPIERIEQLLEHFQRGEKPRSAWRLGTESEKIVVDAATARAAPFSGAHGVEALLRGLADAFGWEPQEEAGRVIALSRQGTEITLEPGGQVELSGKAFATVHEARSELDQHLREITSVGDDLGLAFLGLGIQPLSRVEEIEWVPKRRYGIMGPYMTQVGTMGHRMMKQTATVQVNLDFESESDAMRKMRVATGIGPILHALFANSPLVDGRLSGWTSFRGHIWTDTDNSRSGILPFVFSPHASYEHYVRWALDVPMYFIKRRGSYVDMSGTRFREFLEQGHAGHRATVGDFALHLSTLFPEARLKTYIELRMVDSQPADSLLGLTAITKGLFYEGDCLDAAWDLVKDWTLEERGKILRAASRSALQAMARRVSLRDLAVELVEIAEEGLRRQACLDERGQDERVHLEATRERARAGRAPGTSFAERWERELATHPARLVAATAYASAVS